jgi:2-dehydropantoate 2-reductase
VVSFQNGVRNPAVLRSSLPAAQVLAGMVPYNVVWKPGAWFHCGTSGDLLLEDQGASTQAVLTGLAQAGLAARSHPNLPGVQWGKLVLNLNNPINALANIPLRAQLIQPLYRSILAATIGEALAVLKRSGIRPLRAGRALPTLAPLILRLPNRLFFRVAASMIKIDPQARSSMWEDLQRGRQTEIDYLNGEIVALARQHGLAAPINSGLVVLIKAAERSGVVPTLSALELARQLGLRQGPH